jgi:hypothetical protein
LIIDDISSITPTTKKVIERLKTLCNCRRRTRNQSGEYFFIWNFEKLEVKNLPQARSLLLINQLANNLEVQDREMFWNHIFDQTVKIRLPSRS